MKETNLQEANLKDASLQLADFSGANLSKTDLQGANLEEARNLTVEQLSMVKTLYKTKLDPNL